MAANNKTFSTFLQNRLKAHGYSVDVSGRIGKGNDDPTRAALRAFQRRMGLKVSGMADQATVDALRRAAVPNPKMRPGTSDAGGGFALRPFRAGEKVNNADGSYSTERTVTVQMPDGGWANVPSLWMGPNGPVDMKAMGMNDDAIAQAAGVFERKNGTRFVRFGNIDQAVSAARARSEAGGAGAETPRYQIPGGVPPADDMQRPGGFDRAAWEAARAATLAQASDKVRAAFGLPPKPQVGAPAAMTPEQFSSRFDPNLEGTEIPPMPSGMTPQQQMAMGLTGFPPQPPAYPTGNSPISPEMGVGQPAPMTAQQFDQRFNAAPPVDFSIATDPTPSNPEWDRRNAINRQMSEILQMIVTGRQVGQ